MQHKRYFSMHDIYIVFKVFFSLFTMVDLIGLGIDYIFESILFNLIFCGCLFIIRLFLVYSFLIQKQSKEEEEED